MSKSEAEKRGFMWWMARLLRWQWRQPILIRWLAAILLFFVALIIRYSITPYYGPVPFVSFYPAVLAATLLLGWKEAIFVLTLSLAAGCYFFLPPGMPLMPVGWALVGGSNIAIIIALKALAQRLAEANERQRILFEELQHRTANTLQATAGTLKSIRKRLNTAPIECADILDEAIERMSTSADMHRRLHRPELFNGLEPMLREIITAAIGEAPSVTLDLQIEAIALSLDQQSIVAMLVMEIATNSAKHVFRENRDSHIEVRVMALPGNRASLSIKDDGPGCIDTDDRVPSYLSLGTRLLQGFADQLHGNLVIEADQGRKVTVTFPTYHQKSRKQPSAQTWISSRKRGRSAADLF